jgi:hypothetical protein
VVTDQASHNTGVLASANVGGAEAKSEADIDNVDTIVLHKVDHLAGDSLTTPAWMNGDSDVKTRVVGTWTTNGRDTVHTEPTYTYAPQAQTVHEESATDADEKLRYAFFGGQNTGWSRISLTVGTCNLTVFIVIILLAIVAGNFFGTELASVSENLRVPSENFLTQAVFHFLGTDKITSFVMSFFLLASSYIALLCLAMCAVHIIIKRQATRLWAYSIAVNLLPFIIIWIF